MDSLKWMVKNMRNKRNCVLGDEVLAFSHSPHASAYELVMTMLRDKRLHSQLERHIPLKLTWFSPISGINRYAKDISFGISASVPSERPCKP